MFQFSSLLIHTGTETQITLKPTLSYITDDAISAFTPEDRGCYANGEAILNYLTNKRGYRYEMNNCLIDEGIRDITWNCRCLPNFAKYGSVFQYAIPTCFGEKLHCANTRMKSMGMGGITKENNVSVPEALTSPNMIENITMPDSINCMPACHAQENSVQMSFASYPQGKNFFYQKIFCDVASHIWQRTCQNENREYFLKMNQPLLCPLLKSFDEYFGYHQVTGKNNLVRKPL